MNQKINHIITTLEKTMTIAPPEAELASKVSKITKDNSSMYFALTKQGTKVLSILTPTNSATISFSKDNKFTWSNKSNWEDSVNEFYDLIMQLNS
jgi:hypothetical protein